ncbi:hypothetical protein [Pseudomonas indica]|uniref:4-amino-4-deoxy-L-arabinose transferase n=1 Tax=Pseudomonas indica TaxID=137658 RepID=A0A1G9M8T0_9PSED|nr:hypothetical protein [Pseudomonas indica]SDL70656.1 4-amino-4-deoxy-L-arabinose transferase [Pseudomonas indica]
MRLSRLLLPLVVLFFVFLLYWPVKDFFYVWDDFALFLDSSALRGSGNVWEAISQPILPGTTYFRPLVLLSFWSEFKLFGVNPAISHVVNLFIQLLNISLVGWLAHVLVGREGKRWQIVLPMVAYGIHPALVEPVAWSAGRFDLLVTTCTLLALISALECKGKVGGIVLSGIFFLLALLSKEMAITFPALFVVCYLVKTQSSLRESFMTFMARPHIWLFVSLFVAGALYLSLRYSNLQAMYHQDPRVSAALNSVSHFALVGQTIIFYLRMIVWPFSDINPMHPFDVYNWGAGQLISGGLALFSLSMFGVYALVKRSPALLLVLAGFISLAPVLNVIPLTIGGNIGHERFLTLPLVFFALAIGWGRLPGLSISSSMKKALPKLSWLLGGGWVLLGVMNVTVTLPLWRDEVSLWSWSYEKYPDFEYVQFSLVAAAVRLGRLDTAQKVLDEIEAKGELSLRIKAIKGQLLARVHRPEEALKLLNEALAGSYQPHLKVLNKGIQLKDAKITNRGFSESWYLRFVYGARAEANLSLKRYNDALADLEVVKFYQEDYAPAYLLTALALYGKDEVKAADESFNKALGFYVKEGAKDAIGIKENFISQLCRGEGRPLRVCELEGDLDD